MAGAARCAGEHPCMEKRIRVTARAESRRALECKIFVAAGAVQRGMRAGEREGRPVVVKCGRQPAGGGVTCPAGGAKSSAVRIIFGVTGKTIGGCAFEDAVDVTIGAWYSGMLPVEFE